MATQLNTRSSRAEARPGLFQKVGQKIGQKIGKTLGQILGSTTSGEVKKVVKIRDSYGLTPYPKRVAADLDAVRRGRIEKSLPSDDKLLFYLTSVPTLTES